MQWTPQAPGHHRATTSPSHASKKNHAEKPIERNSQTKLTRHRDNISHTLNCQVAKSGFTQNLRGVGRRGTNHDNKAYKWSYFTLWANGGLNIFLSSAYLHSCISAFLHFCATTSCISTQTAELLIRSTINYLCVDYNGTRYQCF